MDLGAVVGPYFRQCFGMDLNLNQLKFGSGCRYYLRAQVQLHPLEINERATPPLEL